MRRCPSIATVALGLVLFASAPVVAQQGTGELRGRVLDEQNAVLPGVAVVARNEGSRPQVRCELVLPTAPPVQCRHPERFVHLLGKRPGFRPLRSAHISRPLAGPCARRERLLREGQGAGLLCAGQMEDQQPFHRQPWHALRRRDCADRPDGQLPLLRSFDVPD